MYHYSHHIGDYRTHTAHLTMMEDGAYRRLLDIYYMHEKPLPADVVTVQRLAAARSKEERAAVESVLREFFVLTDDGWHQGRADEELETYHAKANTSRKNGKGGGRPRKKPGENPAGFARVPENNPEETVTVNRKPITNREAPQGLPPDEHQTSRPEAAREAPEGGHTHDTGSILARLAARKKA